MTASTEIYNSYRKLSVDEWREAWIDYAEGKSISVQLPAFPPEEIQKITNNKTGRKTVEAAFRMYEIFNEELHNFELEKQEPLTALDLGAGWGRITRLMTRNLAPENISAVDVDKKLVSAGKGCLPEVNWEEIVAGKPLPFDDGQFSLVLANSVLSHLDEHHHMHTVKEVSRVLRPGGIFLGTTLSEKHYSNYMKYEDLTKWLGGIMGDHEVAQEGLRNGKFTYGHSNRLEGYGMTFLPEGWTNKHWSPYLKVRSIRTDYAQDVQIAQKL